MNKIIVLFFVLVSFSFSLSNDVYAQETNMFFKKTISGEFNQVLIKVKAEFKSEGFGVMTEIDMDQKLKEKLDVELKPYKILGVCNPGFAYEAMQTEPNIGVFLPCKVIIKQLDNNEIEVVSYDPVALMKMLENEELTRLAEGISAKIKAVIENI